MPNGRIGACLTCLTARGLVDRALLCEQNLALVEGLKEMAAQKGCTAGDASSMLGMLRVWCTGR